MEFYNRILDTLSGNAVIVAMDHGMVMGAMDGFTNAKTTLQSIQKGKPDGILVGPHFARHLCGSFTGKLILTVDWVSTSTVPGAFDLPLSWATLFKIEELAVLGADAVKVLMIFGGHDRDSYRKNVTAIADLACSCHKLNLPLIVEPVFLGESISEDQQMNNPKLVAHACRMAWEIGADIIKVGYVGPVDSFSEIVTATPVPVMVLGGPARDQDFVLQMVTDAMLAGARGVMLGRNVWNNPNPSKMIQSVAAIVHNKI